MADTPYAPLRPAARPVDTYARPAGPPQRQAPDPSWGRNELASALSSLNQNLTKFIPAVTQKEHAEAEAQAKEILAGMTFEEAMAKQKAGELAIHDNPFVNQHLNIHYGQKFAEWRADELGRRFHGESTSGDSLNPNHFDHSQDAEKWARGQMVQDLEQLEGKDARNAYITQMEKWLPHLRAAQSKEKAEYTAGRAADAAFDNLYGIARDAITAAGEPGKVDPNAVHATMRKAYPQLTQLWSLQPPQLKAVMVKVADRLAEDGQFGLVDAIFNNDPDGFGPLNNKISVSAHGPKILEKAREKWLEKARSDNLDARVYFHDRANQGLMNEGELETWRKANPGLVTDQQAESWILHNRQVTRANQEEVQRAALKAQREAAFQQQETQLEEWLQKATDAGGLLFLQPAKKLNKSGEVVEESADSLRKRGITNYLTQVLPRQAQLNGWSPEQTFNERLRVISKNGVVDPEWQEVLSHGFSAANNPNITAETMPVALTGSYQLYKQLHAKAPQTLAQHVTDRDGMDFYETARVGEQYMGMGERDALLWAATVHRDPTQFNTETTRRRYDDLKTQLDTIKNQGAWDKVFGDKVENINVAAPDFERMAGMYVRIGMNTDTAIKLAAERLKGQYTNINGWLVETSDARTRSFPSMLKARDEAFAPTDFGTAFKSYLDDWAKKHGDISGSDIGVLQTAPGVFMLVGKKGARTGVPLIDFDNAKGLSYVVKFEDIFSSEVQRQLAERVKAGEQVQAENEARYMPWFTNDFVSIGPFKAGGFTPEETAIIEQNRQEQRQNGGLTRDQVDAAGRFGGRKH